MLAESKICFRETVTVAWHSICILIILVYIISIN